MSNASEPVKILTEDQDLRPDSLIERRHSNSNDGSLEVVVENTQEVLETNEDGSKKETIETLPEEVKEDD